MPIGPTGCPAQQHDGDTVVRRREYRIDPSQVLEFGLLLVIMTRYFVFV